MIALSYVVLLSTVGGLMFWEGLRAILAPAAASWCRCGAPAAMAGSTACR